jgi:hypothetical protein
MMKKNEYFRFGSLTLVNPYLVVEVSNVFFSYGQCKEILVLSIILDFANNLLPFIK